MKRSQYEEGRSLERSSHRCWLWERTGCFFPPHAHAAGFTHTAGGTDKVILGCKSENDIPVEDRVLLRSVTVPNLNASVNTDSVCGFYNGKCELREMNTSSLSASPNRPHC